MHHRAGFERLASRIDALALRDRILSAITLAALRTMVAKSRAPVDKDARLRLVHWRAD